MSIVDVIAFFSIMPLHRKLFDDNREQFPKLTNWADKMTENEDLMGYLSEVKLESLTKVRVATRAKL